MPDHHLIRLEQNTAASRHSIGAQSGQSGLTENGWTSSRSQKPFSLTFHSGRPRNGLSVSILFWLSNFLLTTNERQHLVSSAIMCVPITAGLECLNDPRRARLWCGRCQNATYGAQIGRNVHWLSATVSNTTNEAISFPLIAETIKSYNRQNLTFEVIRQTWHHGRPVTPRHKPRSHEYAGDKMSPWVTCFQSHEIILRGRTRE